MHTVLHVNVDLREDLTGCELESIADWFSYFTDRGEFTLTVYTLRAFSDFKNFDIIERFLNLLVDKVAYNDYEPAFIGYTHHEQDVGPILYYSFNNELITVDLREGPNHDQ